MKLKYHKIALGILIIFFIYFVCRPKEIVPAFLNNVISLETLDSIRWPIRLLPFVAIVILLLFFAGGRRSKSGRTEEDNKRNVLDRFFRIAPWFFSCMAIALIFYDLTALSARHKVINFLDKTSSDVMVRINGQPFEDPNQLITKLKKMSPYAGNGSHTTNEIYIEIGSGSEILKIRLGRDSRREREYWVFYPKYHVTSGTDIGSITTDMFDDY